MNRLYVTSALIGLMGLVLLLMTGGSGEPVTIGGVLLPAQVIKGVGIIACIVSFVVFLAAYGGIQSSETIRSQR